MAPSPRSGKPVPAHIIVVEDNLDNQELLVKFLRHHGYRITAVGRGGQLLDLLERERPDLVMMDLSLPDGDGLNFVRRIRADQRFDDLPVIAVTAFAMRDDRSRALAAGCSDYMAKPLDLAAVVRMVARFAGPS